MDMADRETLEELFSSSHFDRVIHLAAQAGVRYSLTHPHEYVQSNLVAFVNLLECCRQQLIGHLVYASSSSVYGTNEKQPFAVTDNVDHPVSLYAATKKSNELMAHAYSHLYQLPTTGLRFFTVYGPWGRPDMAYFLFAKAILAGEPIRLFNEGKMRRDFTYIDDVVDGILRVMDTPPATDGETPHYAVYNIGHNEPVNLLEFVETLEAALGKTAIREYLPMQPGDVKETWADIGPLQQAISYKPETSLATGIGNFVDWYRRYYPECSE
jgi:UDP-glucuronate 4-epimerase